MSNELPEIASKARTRAIMETYGLTFKESQAKLFDRFEYFKKIVAAAEVGEEDDVIEIGPGIGALTEQLAKSAHQVMALEIDSRLIPVLSETLSPYDNVKIVEQDVLKADLKELIAQNFDGRHKIKLVANLPYYITTPIVMHLIEVDVDFETIVVMMQKEVADRLAAQPGTKDYGSLSVAVQYEMDAKIAFIVPKTVFMPQPKVDSAIIALNRKDEKPDVPVDEPFFKKMVKGIFLHRRKSLWNNLQGLYGKDSSTREKLEHALKNAEIEKSVRAERLSISQMVRLADNLFAEKLN